MPAATFYQPIEAILNGNCQYEYYDYTSTVFSQEKKTRICKVSIPQTGERNKNVILMEFTIRNQPSRERDPVWKIHSEGPQRTDAGATVPLRNAAVKLAKQHGWKYIAIAVAGEGTPATDIISRYIISMESYDYGNDTVYDVSKDLDTIASMGEPNFYRCNANVNGKHYSLSYIKKTKFIDYLTMFDNRPYGDYESLNDNESQQQKIEKGGFNKIFYGAPGCGKSRLVSDLIKEAGVNKENVIRVTFHPEYSNCDFIGQILPTIDVIDEENGERKELVKYIFNPGPLSLALKTAYNSCNMVYLIIEEINRGNAAAIFGDMFQLLDRVRDFDDPDFSASEYPVCNPNMQKWLAGEVRDDSIKTALQQGIYIPSNLTIFATMNSSDQNVFTLDTAFKRRWSFEQISNDIEKDTNHAYKEWFVPGTAVTWERFLTKLNQKILENKLHNQTNEDKRLGKYFVTKECLTEKFEAITDVQETGRSFAYKVLEYIWNDVCKIGREDWFDVEKHLTLEDLIDAFLNPSEGNTPLSVFQNIDF